MKTIDKKQQKSSKLQEFRDGVIGLAILVALGFWGWSWLTGADGAEPATVTAPSPEDAARQEEAAKKRAEAERVEADQLAAAAKTAEEAEKVKAAQKAEEDAHAKRYGFNCLSGWDGSHRGLVDAVKKNLNDPRSFEHDETRTWPVNEDGRNRILMTYRAKNGFGALMLGKATGSFDNTTCNVLLESAE